MTKKKAVFLDRDGVINKLITRDGIGRAPYSLEDLELFPGVEEACQKLKELGYLAIIVTNQPDVARGWVPFESVELINNHIKNVLPIDEIKICFHVNEDKCLCRKPAPGMLLTAALDWEIDLSSSYMIGDRFGDIAAGKSAGCTTILIGPGDKKGDYLEPHFRADSLLEAVSIIFSGNTL